MSQRCNEDIELQPHRGSELQQLSTALVGRYVLERELGRGGMATVFLVHDLRHDRLGNLVSRGSKSSRSGQMPLR